MKKLFFVGALLIICNLLFAQIQNPVEWNATAKKISDKTYEIHLTANIEDGWHIYSQSTPDGGPIPTNISFTKNPLLEIVGNAKEIGKLEQHMEPLFGVQVKQFSDKVVLVQVVKMKANVKTAAAVAITYMVCNDHQCLPPSTKKLTVALN